MKRIDYNYTIKMWMTTGHKFELNLTYNERLSCEDKEHIMHYEAIKRRFLGGINDIESYDTNLELR